MRMKECSECGMDFWLTEGRLHQYLCGKCEENEHLKAEVRRLQQKEKYFYNSFDTTEIQYLRGLVISNKLTEKYEELGDKALIAQNKNMHDFTEEILAKLDELEDEE